MEGVFIRINMVDHCLCGVATTPTQRTGFTFAYVDFLCFPAVELENL